MSRAAEIAAEVAFARHAIECAERLVVGATVYRADYNEIQAGVVRRVSRCWLNGNSETEREDGDGDMVLDIRGARWRLLIGAAGVSLVRRGAPPPLLGALALAHVAVLASDPDATARHHPGAHHARDQPDPSRHRRRRRECPADGAARPRGVDPAPPGARRVRRHPRRGGVVPALGRRRGTAGPRRRDDLPRVDPGPGEVRRPRRRVRPGHRPRVCHPWPERADRRRPAAGRGAPVRRLAHLGIGERVEVAG